ncbi:MAG: hypothetical protein ACRERC_21435 [Candidatus Binatia bacterium]
MKALAAWPWLIAVGAAALVFHPILGVEFHGDDFLHLYEIENLGLLRFLVKTHGSHLLITCNAVFYALHALFGPDPAPYMWVMLLTHLLNVGLFVALLQRLTHSPWLACFGGVLWGASPINAGALAWYSVYGQVLATGLMLGVMLQLARVADGAACGRAAPWLWAAMMLAAGASFGVGIALALAMPGVAWLLLPATPARRRIVAALSVAALALPPLYYGVRAINITSYLPDPEFKGADESWFGMVRFLAHLFAVGGASLVLGGHFQPAEYPGPKAAAGLTILAALILFALVRGSAKQRRQILAGLLLAVAAYGVIAMGRSALFSSEVSAVLVRSARYHYAAPLGLALALSVAGAAFAPWAPRHAGVRAALFGLWLALAGAGYAAAPRINEMTLARAEADKVLAEIRAAAAARPPGAPVYVPNRRYFLSPLLYINFPGWAGLFAVYHPDDHIDGHRVYFVVDDPAQLAAWRNGRRGTRLLVAPDEVPPP